MLNTYMSCLSPTMIHIIPYFQELLPFVHKNMPLMALFIWICFFLQQQGHPCVLDIYLVVLGFGVVSLVCCVELSVISDFKAIISLGKRERVGCFSFISVWCHVTVSVSGLQIRVRIGKLFSLFLIQNICCGYSLRRFFCAPKTHFKFIGKKIIEILPK